MTDTKPIITVKNVQYNERLSTDSLCFSATVYVDGKRFGIATDTGMGGMVNVEPYTYPKDMKEWKSLVRKTESAKKTLNIAITGKYTELHDSYVSIMESLKSSCGKLGVNIKLKWLETTDIENKKVKVAGALRGVHGIIVPGGAGHLGRNSCILSCGQLVEASYYVGAGIAADHHATDRDVWRTIVSIVIHRGDLGIGG